MSNRNLVWWARRMERDALVQCDAAEELRFASINGADARRQEFNEGFQACGAAALASLMRRAATATSHEHDSNPAAIGRIAGLLFSIEEREDKCA